MADREVADAVAGSFLATLPSEVVDELIAEGERTDYPAGSVVYREGSAPRAALVVRGLIRVYLSSREGRQVTVRYARDSDVLGIAVIVGGPASVSVQTLAPTSLFSINSRKLTEVARQDARVAWAVVEELNRRLVYNGLTGHQEGSGADPFGFIRLVDSEGPRSRFRSLVRGHR